MEVLLDECAPRFIRRHLPGHSVATVQETGWSGMKNGDLLDLAQKEFDVFITTDQNLEYQQNLSGKNIAVILLPSNRVPVVKKMIAALQKLFSISREDPSSRSPSPRNRVAHKKVSLAPSLRETYRAARSS